MKLTGSSAALAPLLAACLNLPLDAQSDQADQDRRRTPIVDLVERARPAVVSIDCSIGRGAFSIFSSTSSGTGVVLYEDGVLVTNYHVVFPGDRVPDRILVRFDQSDDATPYEGEVLSFEKSEDLALVKIKARGPFPTIEMSTDEPLLGETVVAIGNAVGRSHTVSSGIISGLHRDLPLPELGLYFKQLLQTDAAINLGNSGGPLLDINGKLVGINTAMTRDAENVGYAIPVARVRSVLQEKLLHPSRARSYLGYTVDEDSFLVTTVLAGGPADLAGMLVGDRLLAIDGKVFADAESYNLQRVAIAKDAPVRITARRGGTNKELQLQAWDLVRGVVYESLGVELEPAFLGPTRERFLRIASVDPGGPAGRIGLKPKDVITAIRPDGWRRAMRFTRADELATLLVRLESDTTVEIEILRDDDGDRLFTRNEGTTELYQGKLRVR